MDSEFSDASITNSVSASSGSASARRINLEPGPFVETDVHRLICKVGREGDVWHGDLEVVHGLTEAESCECFSVAGKYLHEKVFPADATNKKLFAHTEEGWRHLKEVDRLANTHAQENIDLWFRNPKRMKLCSKDLTM